MGAILDTPHTEKTTENGTGNDLRFGVCSMQGWRTEMEDAHCAKVGLKDLQDWSFFAVFDGHAGAYVSAHCARNLLNTILQTDSFLKYAIASSSSSSSPSAASNSKSSNGDSTNASSIDGNSIADCPVDDDCDVLTTNKTLENIKSSMREGFLELDERMKSLPEVESGDISGSTVVCAFISPTHFFFANCGDSRAVLSRNGRAFFSTQDHKPINPAEKERIQRAGGSVMIQRVNGSLAVSRALGDYQYKQVVGRGPCEQLVSPEPEITIHERSEDDEFLIFACDGIWDVMSNDDLCDFVRHQLRIHSNLELVCSSIIDTCLHKGSTDNMSVVLITFNGAPKVCEDAQRKDAELNAIIEKEVNRLLKTNVESQTSIYILMQSLKNIDFENLPPGGGLDAKRSIIDEAQKRFVAENSSPNNNNSASATSNTAVAAAASSAAATTTSNNNNATTASSLENDCPNN